MRKPTGNTVLDRRCDRFKGCQQQDAQEFLVVLLDLLHEELKSDSHLDSDLAKLACRNNTVITTLANDVSAAVPIKTTFALTSSPDTTTSHQTLSKSHSVPFTSPSFTETALLRSPRIRSSEATPDLVLDQQKDLEAAKEVCFKWIDVEIINRLTSRLILTYFPQDAD
ncbi:unnamed protein product [Protopolystoma xenopodis]|uniref:Peptidase C19 ubiquitin carboxyl-terminal hydrolase domain-containing protein n=1 Tax=Protopolystoma xenopodis TaxID=117903 RepID=A0A3S5BLY1_9PLAT|nr:unnamed protein product [Protopolystoma xenopodis]